MSDKFFGILLVSLPAWRINVSPLVCKYSTAASDVTPCLKGRFAVSQERRLSCRLCRPLFVTSFMRYHCFRAIFVWPWKMVSVSVRYLFYQPMDEKIKTWTLRFPAKENPNMEKALFDWPIVLQYDVKAKNRLISRKFSGMKFFHLIVRLTNQKPRSFVSVPYTNQIALFAFVGCFCFVRAFSFQGHTKIALPFFREHW